MAVEKGKVLAKLEEKFKGKSISKTFKDSIATKWAEKIDNETDIDDYISDREEIINETIAEADRRATDALKNRKPEPTPSADPPTDPTPPSDAPDWFKVYAEASKKQLEAVTEKLSGYEKQQTAKTIEQRFRSDERLKGVPEFAFKGRIPQTEEEIENAVNELASDWQGHEKSGFGNDNPGYTPTTPAATGKVDPSVAAFAKKQNEQFINETKK